MQYRGRYEVEEQSAERDRLSRESTKDKNTLKLLILFFACFAVNSDQLASAPNLTQISQNFRLSVAERDSHLGALIQFGFFMSAGLFSILSGPVIEVVDRSKLLAGVSAISSRLSFAYPQACQWELRFPLPSPYWVI